MRNRQFEAYAYYQGVYPGTLLFFHVGDKYVALYDDAVTISKIMEYDRTPECIEFPDSDMGFVSDISEHDIKIKIIEYRNANGVFDYPDIDKILEDQSDDY